MKKFLSFILVLIVVFSLGTNVVFADEYVENLISMYGQMGMSADDFAAEIAGYGLILDTDAMQIIDAATGAALSEEEFNALMGGGASSGVPTSPSGIELTDEDYKSEKVVYQIEKIGMKTKEGETVEKLYFKFTVYVMGTDAYLNYLVETGAMQQTPYEESKFNEKRAIIVNNVEISENELASNMGIGYIEDEEKEQYIIPMGDMSEMLEQDQDMDGVPDYKKGDVLMTFAFKFGDDIETHEICVGQPNSKVITYVTNPKVPEKETINWTLIIIISLSIIVVVLSVFVVLLTIKCRKKVKKQNSLKGKKYVSEDNAFEELIKEVNVYMENDEKSQKTDEESEEKQSNNQITE